MTENWDAGAESTRGRVLRALGSLLAQRDWLDISVSDVAAAAGVVRQTVYNEFGARSTLAEAYVESLVDQVIRDHLPTAEEVGLDGTDVDTVLTRILTSWFASVAADPVLGPGVDRGRGRGRGLLRGLVADESQLVEKASLSLARRYGVLAPHVPEAQARVLARVVVRLCVSYLLMLPSREEDPVEDLVAVIGPYAEEIFGVEVR